MQANLPNVYAFLLERFGEQYSIAYTTAPTYLKSIVGHEAMEKKIVFLYVEERKGNQTSSPIILTKPKAADDLDLTGSPLKDNCLINGEDVTLDLNMMDLKSCAITPWKLEEEYHRGIDVNKARNAICSKLFQQDQFCNDQGSVWILCNGKDSEKVLLLQVELNSEFNSRGIVTYQGVTPVSELTSVQPLLRKHCSGIRPGSAMETFIENVYEIKSNDIKVHCSWTTSVSLPALINLASCDIILSQTFRLCECCPLTHDLIEQLRILTSIREDILIYKEAEANNQIVEPVYRCGCGMERADLKDAISKVMTEVSGFAENEIVTDIENDIEAVVRMAKLRRSTDLTDKLWDILKRCSNYKELKTAFQLLFQCSARFNIIALEFFFKFGYAFLIITLIIMIWMSLARASIYSREMEEMRYPPCTFNAMCTCSKSATDLGIVRCKNVPFPALPKMVNQSKVFMLHMENTGLREIEPYFLQSTGMYRLKISGNHLTEIPDDAFTGLERSLWELILPQNDLVEIPSKSFRHMQKLRHLDLGYNHITHIHLESFRGLEESLQTLILRENCISMLQPHTFSSLLILETLDLSGNNLFEIDSSVFVDGMPRLSKLLLTDNILSEIPYDALTPLKSLRTLDISHNVIWSVGGNETYDIKSTGKLNLDNLHLEYNHIHVLSPNSFKNFDVVNRTFFDGNPIHTLREDAFKSAKIREIYMRYCGLTHISPVAFDSLVNSLQILDLSGNNLTHIDHKLFNNFDVLRVISMRDNKIKIEQPLETFNAMQYTLLKLDLSGDKNDQTNLQTLRNMTRMRNMRSLSMSRMGTTSIGPDDFKDFGVELEDLQITRAGLSAIQSHAFKHVRGLKRLDFSENSINTIDSDAFHEIGHSLISLKISHGFTGTALPADPLRHLTSLQELDFSNNKITSMSDTSFHFLKNLRLLELHDNRIEQVMKGTFQGDIHSKLEEISLRFNHMTQVSQHTFFDLEALRKLHLDDNKIDRIERRAFMNLDELEHLSLRGNKLSNLAEESFQNLPKLEYLDMAFNNLPNFNFDYFDQVGTLSNLNVNVSHNQIKMLMYNSSWNGRNDHGSMYHSNIKILDLSHNNISVIHPGYFRPAEISLTHLHLGYNSLLNATRDVFGNMPHLQWLDISYNLINEVDFDAFKNTKNLQILYISHNYLTDIPQDLFKPVHSMRIVDFSYNHLRGLPDNLFYNGGMEKLDVSHNLLLKIPSSSLSSLAALTLCELHLSNNFISTIHSMDLSNKFRSLRYLDISYNYLLRIDDAVFATMPKLAVLDLSHNRDLKVMDKSFMGLENSLIKLGLENVSLSTVPEIRLKYLRELRLGYNELPSIPQEMAHNMSNLRMLDLSNNDLTNVPLMTQSLPHLRKLRLSGNPITSLNNNSFEGVNEDLEMLDISNFRLHYFEYGCLDALPHLRSLKLTAYSHLEHFNIPHLLHHHYNIRELWIEAPQPFTRIVKKGSGPTQEMQSVQMGMPTDLAKEMEGHLPSKLTNITLSGPQFSNINEHILKGMRSPYLYLQLFNTSLQALPNNFFKHMGRVRNISLDIRYHNRMLRKIPNPNTGSVPYLPESVFLTDLKMSRSDLNCDCDLGWVEFWQRKRRQYICSSQTWTDTVFRTFMNSPCQVYGRHDCDEYDDDLRETRCDNKGGQQLMEALKSDLECGWDNAACQKMYIMLIAVCLLLVFWM